MNLAELKSWTTKREVSQCVVHDLSLCLRVLPLVDPDRAMVIAVIAMEMVQGSLVEIILMISMGNERVSAALMPAFTGDRSARRGIVDIYFKHMLIRWRGLVIHKLLFAGTAGLNHFYSSK